MIDFKTLKRPEGVDWNEWSVRWDRMQERYISHRAERFELICRLIQKTQPSKPRVLDLGCGPGSLMLSILEPLPESEVSGIDFNPTLMWLAGYQLKSFGSRSQLIFADLRASSWLEKTSGPFNAVVSATSLHWLSAAQPIALYKRIGSIMSPGGIFLNADHIGSDYPVIQKFWEEHRQTVRAENQSDSDDWLSFWTGYSHALGLDTKEIHNQIMAGYEKGVEEGLPLSWHFDRLRECGFRHVDCFWRDDCDAVYGGIYNI